MNCPIGPIYVEETRDNIEFTFYLDDLELGRTRDLEKWNSLVVSTDGRSIVAMINKKLKKIIYSRSSSSLVYTDTVHLYGD